MYPSGDKENIYLMSRTWDPSQCTQMLEQVDEEEGGEILSVLIIVRELIIVKSSNNKVVRTFFYNVNNS